MISICIPIYNYYAYPLVRRLSNQIAQLDVASEVEIVCIDDHSSGYYLNQNMGICDIATYLRLAENIGRSRIRNLFLKYAKGDWLLFLDNDAHVPDKYIKSCLKYVNTNADVIVGGTQYDPKLDDAEHHLRYLYGTSHEGQDADQRSKTPYASFLVNNTMIRRSVLERIKFDPRITTYGYEDTLFAYRLESAEVPVLHVDNPVVHGYLELNMEYLHKVIEGIGTLVDIYNFMWEDQRFLHKVPLLERYAKIRRRNQQRLIYTAFKLFKSPMESHFASGNAISLKQFEFYKLGLFIRKMHYDSSKDESNTE